MTMTEKPYFLALKPQGRSAARWLESRGQFATMTEAVDVYCRVCAAQLRGLRLAQKTPGLYRDLDTWGGSFTEMGARVVRKANDAAGEEIYKRANDLACTVGEMLTLAGVNDTRVDTLLRLAVVFDMGGPVAWVMMRNSRTGPTEVPAEPS